MSASSRRIGGRATPLLSLLLLLLASSCIKLVDCACTPGDSGGFLPCYGAGACRNLTTRSITSQGIVTESWSTRCLCDVNRFETDLTPSLAATDPSCALSLSAAAPALFTGGQVLLALVLVGLWLLVGGSLLRLMLCTQAARSDTRFERIIVERDDLLSPTRGQLCLARWALAVVWAAVTWWLVDLAVDSFGQQGIIDAAGGYKLQFAAGSGGSLIVEGAPGWRLRYLLEDVSEWLLFLCYVLYFLAYRKACIPAPALLSGNRFMVDYESDDWENRGTAREHNVYVTTLAEAQAAEEAAEAAEEAAFDRGEDDREARDRRWAREEARTLRKLHDELLHADAKQAQRTLNRKAAAEKRINKRSFDQRLEAATGIKVVGSGDKQLPPPPPPTPPKTPAPPPQATPSKTAAKYAVTSSGDHETPGNDLHDTAQQHRPTPGGPASPLRSVLARAAAAAAASVGAGVTPGGPAETPGNPDAASDSSSNSSDSESDQGERGSTPATHSHAIRIEASSSPPAAGAGAAAAGAGGGGGAKSMQAIVAALAAERKLKKLAEARLMDLLPSDETAGPDERDLMSFPVPDFLSLTFVVQILFVLGLLLLIPVAHVLLESRSLYSAALWSVYCICHLWHGFLLLSFWAPLYLISLKEELLAEAGIALPRHRRIVASAGSESTESTDTSSFGLATAYELSKLHSLTQYLFLVSIGASLLQVTAYVFHVYSLTSSEGKTLFAETMVLYTLAVRLLQSLRVAVTFVSFFPWQPLIQYIRLHNFWLPGKLHWGKAASDENLSGAGGSLSSLTSAAPSDAKDELAIRPHLAPSSIADFAEGGVDADETVAARRERERTWAREAREAIERRLRDATDLANQERSLDSKMAELRAAALLELKLFLTEASEGADADAALPEHEKAKLHTSWISSLRALHQVVARLVSAPRDLASQRILLRDPAVAQSLSTNAACMAVLRSVGFGPYKTPMKISAADSKDNKDFGMVPNAEYYVIEPKKELWSILLQTKKELGDVIREAGGGEVAPPATASASSSSDADAASSGSSDSQHPASELPPDEWASSAPTPAAQATAKALAESTCFPLYIRTTFRPIPTREDISLFRAEVQKPLLLAELKRLRTADARRLRQEGGALKGWSRLWRAGARHQDTFSSSAGFDSRDLSHASPALRQAVQRNPRFEAAIAHKQVQVWKEQQLAQPGARARTAAADSSHAKAAAASSTTAKDGDAFKPFQERYGHGDERGLAIAAERVAAAEARGGAEQPMNARQARQEEFRKLRAMSAMRGDNDASAAAAAAAAAAVAAHNAKLKSPLPPVTPTKSAASVLPPLPGTGIRKQVLRSPAAAAAAKAVTAPDLSTSGEDASRRGSHSSVPLLPGSVVGVQVELGVRHDEQRLLNEEDDFVSESRASALGGGVDLLVTPRDFGTSSRTGSRA